MLLLLISYVSGESGSGKWERVPWKAFRLEATKRFIRIVGWPSAIPILGPSFNYKTMPKYTLEALRTSLKYGGLKVVSWGDGMFSSS
jgi:anaerobic selenocysteine-containing dehydrogenase